MNLPVKPFFLVLIVWIRIHKTAEFGSIGIRSITLILVTNQLVRKLLHIFYLHNMPNTASNLSQQSMTSQKTNIFKQQQKSFQSPLLFYMACDIHTVVYSRQIVYVFYNYLFHFIVKPILLLFGFQLVCDIPQLFMMIMGD